jgi:PHP family Zn ribbon phosphoesterase
LIPDLAVAEKFNAKLDKIGNIKSDGRPILGLDARDLFEILLETSDMAILIPAHIWTPTPLNRKSSTAPGYPCWEKRFAEPETGKLKFCPAMTVNMDRF